jgi:hypothetical protein
MVFVQEIPVYNLFQETVVVRGQFSWFSSAVLLAYLYNTLKEATTSSFPLYPLFVMLLSLFIQRRETFENRMIMLDLSPAPQFIGLHSEPKSIRVVFIQCNEGRDIVRPGI